MFVVILEAMAGSLYAWSNVQVILPTAGLYVAAVVWYALWAHKKVLPVALEEVAARIAAELAHKQGVAESKATAWGPNPPVS